MSEQQLIEMLRLLHERILILEQTVQLLGKDLLKDGEPTIH